MIRVALPLIGTMFAAAIPFAAEPLNPNIDYDGFARQVLEVAKLRHERRISEAEFAKMTADPQTVVLDARSREKFALLHIRGAVNLPLPDMTAEELKAIIPSAETTVLIYCNNNFGDDPIAFASKAPAASLNLHTFNVLYSYGYKNVFELAPLLEVATSKLEFDGTRAVNFKTEQTTGR